MKLQKIKQIQQTIIESRVYQNKNGSASVSSSSAMKMSFEQAESLVSRDTISDLFHGKKQLFTMSALAVSGDISSGDEDEFQPAGFGGSQEVLISQWNEKQNGTLDELHGALSPEAPHHPALNYGYTSILAQSGTFGSAGHRPAPVPYVDTRKLVGSRRAYAYHFSGPLARHQMVPKSSSVNTATDSAVLEAIVKERAVEQHQYTLLADSLLATTLPPSELSVNSTEPHQRKSNSKAHAPSDAQTKKATAAAPKDWVQLSDGSYISPEELAYQKRLLKIQAKIARRAELQKTHEEESFLDSILQVSKRVEELGKKKPEAIAVQKGVGFMDHKPVAASPLGPVAKQTPGLMQRKPEMSAMLSLPPQAIIAGEGDDSLARRTPLLNAARGVSRGSLIGQTLSSRTLSGGEDDETLDGMYEGMNATPSSSFKVPFTSSMLQSGKHSASSPLLTPANPVVEKNRFVTVSPPELFETGKPKALQVDYGTDKPSILAPLTSTNSDSPRGTFVTLPPANPEYSHLPTLPAPQIRSLFALLSENNPSVMGKSSSLTNSPLEGPAMMLLKTIESSMKFDPVPILAPVGTTGVQTQTTKPLAAENSKLSSPPSNKRSTSVLLDLTPVNMKARPVPVAAKYAPPATFSPSSSSSGGGTAGFHSLAFHSFSEDAWKGVARVPTPPLIPPEVEDPRKIAIRQGIERAQFRVKSKSRETQIGHKEFSKENQKASMSMKSVALEADRRAASDALSLVSTVIAQKGSLLPGSPVPISSSIDGIVSPSGPHSEPGSPRISFSSDPSAHAGEKRSTLSRKSSSFATPQNDPLANLAQEKRVSVLSMFSTHKAKEMVHKEKQARLRQEKKAVKLAQRKKDLHRSSEVREAAALLGESGERKSQIIIEGDDSDCESGSDSDDPDAAQHPFPRSPLVPLKTIGRGLPKFKDTAIFGGKRESDEQAIRVQVKHHDTFLSDHHRKVLNSFAPGVSSSSTKELDATADALFKEKLAHREHMKRLELLKKDKLRPAPGVDVATLRQQFASSSSNSTLISPAHAVRLHPLREEESKDSPSHFSFPSLLSLSSHSHPPASPTKTSQLGKSQSLPTFLDASAGVSHVEALTATHQSSLSTMLLMSNKTASDLASALPSLKEGFDAHTCVDPADKAVIDALTLPAHMVNASTSDVADRLASMLAPFQTGADPNLGRGIPAIPDYSESEMEKKMLQSFQAGRMDLYKRKVADRQHARAANAPTSPTAASTPEKHVLVGLKAPVHQERKKKHSGAARSSHGWAPPPRDRLIAFDLPGSGVRSPTPANIPPIQFSSMRGST